MKPGVSSAPFGYTSNDEPVERFVLVGAGGMRLSIITYGARIHQLLVPDRHGLLADVVLGYDDISGYEDDLPYHGAVVGRFANRIRNGTFTLDGTEFHLATNNGAHHLHGGPRGFSRVVWSARPFESDEAVGVALDRLSPDGEEGYPGALSVRVIYTLSPSNELSVRFEATTDRATPVNLLQHAYFNLAGEGKGDVLDHTLTIDADAFTPNDADFIPTGQVLPVQGTPLDFRSPRSLREGLHSGLPLIEDAAGYDHNFVLNRRATLGSVAARLSEPGSGRVLEVVTTEPGLQLYTGNFLGGHRGKNGHEYPSRSGVCLETQHFPDSPNHPDFPSTILRPGQKLLSQTRYIFSTEGTPDR